MRPDQLHAQSFGQYPALGREFAIQYLSLLQRLPLSICPSFLAQVQQLDTSFPSEQASLRWQCDFLLRTQQARFADLVAPFDQIRLSPELQASDWVQRPSSFVTDLAAYLWSSGQIDRFRAASKAMFAAIPERDIHPHRLTLVVLGRGTETPSTPLFQQLKKRGVFLTALDHRNMPQQIFYAFRQHAGFSDEPYSHWYIDGGDPWMEQYQSVPGAITISYPSLYPLRKRVLENMRNVVNSGEAGAEQMRSHLASTTAKDLNAAEVASDPILQRFYTELFTQSSGPQLFSTSFVQWTARELARRVQPQTVLLRYAPRQSYRPFDELLRHEGPESLDPKGSLRDADMGAWYTWIEMNRITSAGKGTFVAWLETGPLAVIVSKNAPVGVVCTTPLNLEQAFAAFG